MPNTQNFADNPTQTTISYTYDSLYRLTDAVYSNGFEFHYTYDAVGNRLTQTTCAPNVPCATTAYAYDAANRLIAVNGVAYTWDDNGNLLNDGTSTYAYDSQNRLKTLTQGGHTYGFTYSGNGDRLTQTVDGVVTRYTLDLEAGLTQVLNDGTDAYLYGIDRIAQVSASETDYFLGDALGSVRQLVDASGIVKLAKNYEPYGTVMGSAGSGASAFGFDGEAQQGDQIYLRARNYSSADGRFLSEDPSGGDTQQPMSFNAWLFTYGNPVTLVDRDGNRPCIDWLSIKRNRWLGREFYSDCRESPVPVTNYDQKADPWNITWFPGIDPLREGAGGIPYDTAGAQYEVYGDGKSYYQGRRWTELCGEVSLAAILRLANHDITARQVVEAYVVDKTTEADKKVKANLTGPDQLAQFINDKYGEYFHVADPTKQYRTDYISIMGDGRYDWTRRQASSTVNSILRQWLGARKYPVVSVGIEISQGKIITDPILKTRWDQQVAWQTVHGSEPIPEEYKVCNSPVVCHWVVITGVSNEWNRPWNGQGASHWQWIRTYNPFSNHTEYYWWKDFYDSWSGVGGQMTLVERK